MLRNSDLIYSDEENNSEEEDIELSTSSSEEEESPLKDRIARTTTWKDTVEFVPPISEGRVIKVYDGDTITIASMLPNTNEPLYRFSVRLNGIDTPEMRTDDPDEKEVAVKAKKALAQLILHRWVSLQNVQREKYGRILAEVIYKNVNVNEWMVENRYAVRYDGGTKSVPKSWRAYHHTLTEEDENQA